MTTSAMDLIRQTQQFGWITSPVFLIASLALFVFVFSGLPGQTVLAAGTRLELRREQRRLAGGG